MKQDSHNRANAADPTLQAALGGERTDYGEEFVEITSRVRAWYLTTFFGYRLVTVLRTPTLGPFGLLIYKNRYLLRP